MPGLVKWRSKVRPGAREPKDGVVCESVALGVVWVWLGMVAMAEKLLLI
jgi:hypothetical protein